MWAVAIYDNRDQGRPVVHLVRDRVGIKPLYFTRTTIGEWLFASEIRALLAHPHVPAEMDPLAFWHYLTFIVAPAPLTMFRGVFKLPPATMVTIDHTGRATSRRYWDCKPSAARTFSEKELSYEDALAETERLLRQSIRRRMVSDVPFGVLLSGGVDSSLNVALMSELMDRPVTTFTIGYETHEEFNEFDHARRIAARYKTDHHETRISSAEALEFLPLLVELQDEPIADNVCIPLYFLARPRTPIGHDRGAGGRGRRRELARLLVVRALPKEGGRGLCARAQSGPLLVPARGECGLAQYGRRGDPTSGASGPGAVLGRRRLLVGRLARAADPRSEPVCDERQLPGRGPPPRVVHTHSTAMRWSRTTSASSPAALIEPEVMQKIPYMEMKLRIPEHLLMRVDKMTMAHSVEARVPFLDHDLVEFAMRVPPSYKLSDGLGKKILKKMAEPYVDHDLLYRRKQGFGAPMDKWFQDPSFGRALPLCAGAIRTSTREGFLNKDYVMGLLRGQVGGTINYGFHLWTVMNAVFWHERWIARAPAAAMA